MLPPTPESVHIWLPEAKITDKCGSSLSQTLYDVPVDILLTGPLGAGKTAFIQAFLTALGVRAPIASPTYTLEQRYDTARYPDILHLDLYRLDERAAKELVESSNDHRGIRCVEWAQRTSFTGPAIRIDLGESPEQGGRTLTCSFDDLPLPSDTDIAQWRADVQLPSPVIDHCEAVAHVAGILADDLLRHGILVRRDALVRAARLHDLLRFINFHPESLETFSEAERSCWQHLTERYGPYHEEACTAFLREHGYAAVGTMLAVHGARHPPSQDATIEQELVFYADKRVAGSRIVSVQERLDDFQKRYGARVAAEGARWMTEALRIEAKLFPEGVPTA